MVAANWKKVASIFWQNDAAETDHTIGRKLVWDSIGGAMNASMMYIGDHLGIYTVLRECCAAPGSSVTARGLSQKTGFHQRWLREWLAQQAAMGVLKLLPGSGNDDADLRYRLPFATAEVLASETSTQYDISMIQIVPALVHRAKTMLPLSFASGLGRMYDEPDVAEAIDRHHRRHFRDILLPQVIPKAANGRVLQMLEKGIQVADRIRGAGVLLLTLAQAFPNSTFHGFEISHAALGVGHQQYWESQRDESRGARCYETWRVVGRFRRHFRSRTTFDVLHDSTDPQDLIAQVKASLIPGKGIWLLADIPAAPTIRENLLQMKAPSTFFAFSMCLCMSCALSVEGGAGLGDTWILSACGQ